MNQRIRELAEQAGFGIAGNPEYIHAMDYDGMCTDELEKFAELIVKECCNMMIDLEIKYPANLTVREIKKSFGIE